MAFIKNILSSCLGAFLAFILVIGFGIFVLTMIATVALRQESGTLMKCPKRFTRIKARTPDRMKEYF